MRAFVVLCLVAVACADKLGYNYQPVGHSSSGLSFTPGAASSNVAPSYDGGVGSFEGQGTSGSPSFAPQAELEKEFYTFSADDADFNEPASSEQLANAVKQGLRVVFIKGPESNGLEEAALALAKQAAQQETAIYVLNKQADLCTMVHPKSTIPTNILLGVANSI
uniref:DM5 domain-containing protein n=1 Tax=Musca domestica TaxID=7370 RepID=A0A1I8M695_MUSDO